MDALRSEKEDLEDENHKLQRYKDKLQRKYGKMRENFLVLGEENDNKNLELQEERLDPITIKRVSKEQEIIDTQNCKYFKELLQGPLDVPQPPILTS